MRRYPYRKPCDIDPVDNRRRQLVVEDPVPAGFEPIAGSEKGPFAESMRYDDRMVFFLEDVGERASLSYLAQSEAPGRGSSATRMRSPSRKRTGRPRESSSQAMRTTESDARWPASTR